MQHAAEDQAAVITRLRRIEGQIKGIVRMLEEGRYCIEVLHQIQAAKAALTRAETALLRNHARECVDDALQRGSLEDRRGKIMELVELFERVR